MEALNNHFQMSCQDQNDTNSYNKVDHFLFIILRKRIVNSLPLWVHLLSTISRKWFQSQQIRRKVRRGILITTLLIGEKKLEYDLTKFSKHPKYFCLPPYIYKYNCKDQLKQNESTLWTTSTSKAAKLVTDKQAP